MKKFLRIDITREGETLSQAFYDINEINRIIWETSADHMLIYFKDFSSLKVYITPHEFRELLITKNQTIPITKEGSTFVYSLTEF